MGWLKENGDPDDTGLTLVFGAGVGEERAQQRENAWTLSLR